MRRIAAAVVTALVVSAASAAELLPEVYYRVPGTLLLSPMPSENMESGLIDGFSFPDKTVNLLGGYVASDVVRFQDERGWTQVDLASGGQFRLCDDAACSVPVSDWANASSRVPSAQYVQVRTDAPMVQGSSATVTPLFDGQPKPFVVRTSSPIAASFGSFVPATDADPLTYVVSGIATLSGYGTLPVSIEGAFSKYRVCSGTCTAWLAAPSTAKDGDQIQIQTMASNVSGETYASTLRVGSLVRNWSVRTKVASLKSFGPFAATTNAVNGRLYVSDFATNTGYGSQLVEMTGPSGTEWQMCDAAGMNCNAWNMWSDYVPEGVKFRMRTKASWTAGATVQAKLAFMFGPTAAVWNVTTTTDAPTISNIPDLVNQPAGTYVFSELAAVNGAQNMTVTGPDTGLRFIVCYSTAPDAYCTGPQKTTTVNEGWYVKLRQMTSPTPGATVTQSITYAGQTKTWSVTTAN